MSAERKKLAIFLPTLVGGGAERVFMNLAVGIDRQGYPVDFVLAQREGSFKDQLPASIRSTQLNRVQLKAGRTLSSLPALVRYIRRERPASLLTGMHANIVAVWAKKLAGVPFRLVISEHNTFSLQNSVLPPGFREIMAALVRLNYPGADQIVVVSEGAADDLSRVARIPRHRLRVIYNPIITPDLKLKAQESLDHPWIKPGEPPVMLSVGRLTAQKDFPLLINAFARVRQHIPARLVILGEGPDRSALASLVRRLGLEECVSLPGFVSNPYPYMMKSSVYVLSSRWEGLPTVLVEALYCGVPIVASNCPSGPIEILQNGQYGRLVPVGDLGCLTEAVIEVLKGNTPKIPPESWQPFELDRVTKQYIATLFVSVAA